MCWQKRRVRKAVGENTMTDREKGYAIKDSGERTEFKTGAVRDLRSGKGRFDLLPPSALKALAIHYERGCQKYGDRNWEKGIPISKYLDSAVRHAYAFIAGWDDENHLMASIWNLMCAYETKLRIQRGELPEELDDMPRKTQLPSVKPK